MNMNINIKNDKRSRLINAAGELFHKQGISVTTLANIAQLAGVPLGNVYYYFKSKEDIIIAVIEHRKKLLRNFFEQINSIQEIKARLRAFTQYTLENAENIINYGDALGNLCFELGRKGGQIANNAANIMNDMLNWCETQFTALGKTNAKGLAANFLATLHGIYLLALTFKSQDFINHQIHELIETIA